jgi:hypothetical protein
MGDSENGGKGKMQERNRTVVYLVTLKVEREGFTTGRQFSRFSIQVDLLIPLKNARSGFLHFLIFTTRVDLKTRLNGVKSIRFEQSRKF